MSTMEIAAPTLSVEEAGVLLGISRGLAFRLVREGKIPALRLGKRLRVCRPALEKMLTDPSRPRPRRKRSAAA